MGSARPFHLAFAVADLESTRRFYRDLLGCAEGRSTTTWVDFDFWGSQISAHLRDPGASRGPSAQAHGHVDGVVRCRSRTSGRSSAGTSFRHWL